jgi:hypothetical protein
VTVKIADVVGSAPEVLNSLAELSTALGNDQIFEVNMKSLVTPILNQINSCITMTRP